MIGKLSTTKEVHFGFSYTFDTSNFAVYSSVLRRLIGAKYRSIAPLFKLLTTLNFYYFSRESRLDFFVKPSKDNNLTQHNP